MSRTPSPFNAALAHHATDSFRLLVESVVDYAIYMVDPAKLIASWNPGAERIYGYRADEIIGQPFSTVFTPDDLTNGLPDELWRLTLAAGQHEFECTRVRKDKSQFRAVVTVSTLKDDVGNRAGFSVVTRDITDRKQATVALSESESRYRRLFNAIADPLFVYDRETLAYLDVNDAAVKKYGYSRDEFLGMTIKDIRPVEEVADLLDMLAASGTALEDRGVWKHCKSDGTVMEVEISAYGMDYVGRPACVIHARDVTEKRRAAAEAARANDLLRAVVEGTPDAMFVKDRNGKYLLFNPAAAEFVGKPMEEVLGRDDSALFDPESSRIAMEHDQRVIASNQADTEEEQLTAAGVTRTYLATKMPFQDSEGNIIGVLGISRDITDQKRAEDALRQQQTLLRIAGRVARMGGWSLDLNTRKATWSDEICAIHEVPAGHQPVLEEALNFFPPEYREQVARFVQECAADGTPFDIDVELITAKGRCIWVRSIGEAVRDDEGRIVSLQGALLDKTDYKKAQDEQRWLAERLATTLEAMTDGFVTLDREWRITYLNAEAERLMLRRREDLIGNSIWDAFPETIGITFEREYRRAVAEQVTVDFEEYFPPLAKWFGVRAYPSEQGLAIYFRDVTSARNAEQAFHESEERFRLVSKATNDAIWDWDLTTDSLWWNEGFETLFGYLRAEVEPTCESWRNRIHPADRDAVVTDVNRAIRGDAESWMYEYRFVRRNGTNAFVLDRGYIIRDSGGTAVRMIGGMTDLTQRKRAEESLLLRDRAIQQVSQGIVVTDSKQHDNPIIYASPGLERMTGYRAEELTGRNCRVLQCQDTDQEAVRKLREAIASGQSCTVELLNSRKDGTRFWNELSVNPVRDSKGEVSYYVGVQNDVTERKQLEAERDRLLAQLQLQIERMPLAYLLSDADFRYTRWNPMAERIFGFSQSEVLGKHPFDTIVPSSSHPFVTAIFENIMAGSMDSHGECENTTKHGKTIICEWHNTPMYDQNGAFTGLMSLANDVTERKQWESQYRHSQKMEAVGRLAGGVAHDFNNLLTIISGYSELLLTIPGLDSEIRDLTVPISEAGDRAAALTRQLLSFSRQTMLQPKVLDLNAIVADTGKLLRRLIGEDILITTVLDPKVSRVKVDPGQLDQVLMNLAVNARDAMPKGGKLTIETGNVMLDDAYAAAHPDCKAGHHVLLAMTDTGCGMAPDVVARIFEPFYTTKDVGRGTGLGLAMVFGIVQQSGGCIHVYSEPNRGTSFKIYLPAVSDPLSVKAGSESQSGLKGTETILLVEDDEEVRGLALMSLKTHGYNVLSATDGKDAMKVAKSHRGPLHMVLTDVVMPYVSGPELIVKIKADYPDAKVLIMSGYTDDSVVRHGLIEADVAFIQKPYTPLGLARKVREVLDEKSNKEG